MARFYSEGYHHLEARKKRKKRSYVFILNISKTRQGSHWISLIISRAEKIMQMLKTQLSTVTASGDHSWLLNVIFQDDSIVLQHDKLDGP